MLGLIDLGGMNVQAHGAILHNRQNGATSAPTTTLSLPAIIGIACGGGVIVFAVLTFCLVMHARKKHRQRNATRPLDLDAEPEFKEFNDIPRPQPVPFREGWISDPGTYVNTVQRDRLGMEPLEKPQFVHRMPVSTQYGYHVTSIRDSWPMVSWTRLPESTAKMDNYIPTINSAPPTADNLAHPDWPQRRDSNTHEAQKGIPHTRGHFPISRKDFSRPLTARRSVSDNQLSSILRSTSQRLRESQKRSTSRTMSILSQVSGQPPDIKPPSPPQATRNESREQLVEPEQNDDDPAESVKSSVLDMFALQESGHKKVARSAGSARLEQRSSIADLSDDDSLYGQDLADANPSALSSPSKKSTKIDAGRKSTVSLNDSPVSTKIRSENRMSTSAFNGRDIFAENRTPRRSLSDSDPFISDKAKATKQTTAALGAWSENSEHRTSIFGQTLPLKVSVPMPLQSTSGNRSPSRTASRTESRTESMLSTSTIHPFEFTKTSQLVLKKSPKPLQPVISKRRGHAASKTIRISGLPSLSQADESPSTSQTKSHSRRERAVAGRDSLHVPVINEIAPTPTSIYSRVSSSDAFPKLNDTPLLAPPQRYLDEASNKSSPTLGSADVRLENGHSEHSSVNSLYDYYSSSEVYSPQETPELDTFNTALGAPSDSRRHSQDLSKSDPLGPVSYKFPPPVLPNSPGTIGEPQRSLLVYQSFSRQPWMPESSSRMPGTGSIRPPYHIMPPTISRVQGPRNIPRPAPRDSIHHSISELRRMNSQVSTYSATSGTSDGSPTLPVLRGGGISPNKRKSRGSRHYLSIGRDLRTVNESEAVPVTDSRTRSEHRLTRSGDFVDDAKVRDEKLALPPPQFHLRDIPSPDRDFYDPITPIESNSPNSKTSICDGESKIDMSSGLQIHGLRLPIRDSKGSPLRMSFVVDDDGNASKHFTQSTVDNPILSPASPSRSSVRSISPPKWGAGWERAISPTVALKSPVVHSPAHSTKPEGDALDEVDRVGQKYRATPTRKQRKDRIHELVAADRARRERGRPRPDDVTLPAPSRAGKWEMYDETKSASVQRPERDSLGLFDAQGFLKSSPIRGI